MSSLLTRVAAALQIGQISSLVNTQNPNSTTSTTSTHANNLTTLESTIDNLGDRLEEIPFTFIDTNNNLQSTNVSNDVLIYAGIPVPVGYYGKAQDFNVIFGTTDGTVKLSVMDYNFKNKRSDYQTGLTATNNGTGQLVIDETNTLCLLGQAAGGGTGTVNVLVTGIIRQKRGLVRHRA